MPSKTKRVRFETEYNSSFKAFDPDIYKSPLISALIEEPRNNELDKSKTPAGLKSNKFLKSVEPPLQRKSKTTLRHDKASQTVLNNDKHYGETNDDSNSVKIARNKTKKNRALEYKAGLKTANSLKQTKFPVSEYQREYEWKKSAIGDSPLLNAEKIVFDSHTNIPRFIRDKVPRKTEYQSRFRRDETRQVVRKEEKENSDEKEEIEDKPTSAVKRLLQTSQNPDPPFFPRGSNRVIHTEYQANFSSPKKYQYEEGIWLGAKPPHLLPDDESTTGSTECITNWFEEVLELRARARHYKIRAIEGNYFSREYLAQLDAELEQLYEERRERKNKKESENGDAASQQQSSEMKETLPRVKHAWESDENSENDDINDGKMVYRDLSEQFKDVSSDSETISNHSEHGSLDSGHGSEGISNKNRINPSLRITVNKRNKPTLRPATKAVQTTRDDLPLEDKFSYSEDSRFVNKHQHQPKPSLSKTVNRKVSPTLYHGTTKPPITAKQDAVLTSNMSSGCDASSELSAEPGAESKDSNHESPDKFNIKYIQGMHSNDFEAPSTSVRSNYGSESERFSKTGHDSDSYLSQSSLASQESVARQTLAHAKRRRDGFW